MQKESYNYTTFCQSVKFLGEVLNVSMDRSHSTDLDHTKFQVQCHNSNLQQQNTDPLYFRRNLLQLVDFAQLSDNRYSLILQPQGET